MCSRKKLAVRLLVAAIQISMLVFIIHNFLGYNVAGFYIAHPQRLLYVVVLAAAGGAVIMGFHTLWSRGQRNPRQFSLAALLLVTTAVALALALVRVLMM